MDTLPGGIRRLTFPLPLGIKHVHCYLLPGDDGWTLVDTGLGLPDAAARWEPVLRQLDAPIARILVTHFHPDHAGGGEDAQALTEARAFQGEHDYEQCVRVWGSADWSERLADYLRAGGLPEPVARELRHESRTFAPFIRFARDPEPLREGDEVDGWRVLELPGHADGHLCLLRDGVLVAGDHLLGVITPTVGLYPESRPDPLADYQASLRRTIELAHPRAPGSWRPRHQPGDPLPRDSRAPRSAARRDVSRALLRGTQRLRGLAHALRLEAGRKRPSFRPCGDACAPGTARPGGSGRALRRRPQRLLYCGVDPVGRRSHS